MENITRLSPSALHAHAMNEQFFDNVEGDERKRLKESIEQEGILTPLRVARDLTIISGHQRWSIALELGLDSIPVIIDENLSDKDDMVRQLIASNFGRIKNNPIKMARCVDEYAKLCEISRGRPSKLRQNVTISMDDLASSWGCTTRTLYRLRSLNSLIPTLADEVEEKRITASTASKLLAGLSDDEQEKLVQMLPSAGKITSEMLEPMIAEIKGEYEKQLKEKDETIDELRKDCVEATRAINASEDSKVYREAMEKVEQAKQEIAHAQSTKKQIEERNTKLVTKNNALEQEISAMQQRIASLEDENIDLQNSDKSDELEREIRELKEQLACKETPLPYSDFTTAFTVISNAITSLKYTVSQSSSPISDKSINIVNKMITDLQDILQIKTAA